MSAADVLAEACDLISKGWIQGAGHNEDYTAFCALGALTFAPGAWHYGGEAVALLRQVIDTVSVTVWNDAPGRTQEEVILAFKSAYSRAIAG